MYKIFHERNAHIYNMHMKSFTYYIFVNIDIKKFYIYIHTANGVAKHLCNISIFMPTGILYLHNMWYLLHFIFMFLQNIWWSFYFCYCYLKGSFFLLFIALSLLYVMFTVHMAIASLLLYIIFTGQILIAFLSFVMKRGLNFFWLLQYIR